MRALINPTERLSVSELANIDLGILPYWVARVADGDNLIKGLEEQYGFGSLYSMEGGHITIDGVYKYPEDPDLYPVALIERRDEIVYFYKYGIIAIVYNDGRKTFVTRMD